MIISKNTGRLLSCGQQNTNIPFINTPEYRLKSKLHRHIWGGNHQNPIALKVLQEYCFLDVCCLISTSTRKKSVKAFPKSQP
jgi:hypothetical protein